MTATKHQFSIFNTLRNVVAKIVTRRSPEMCTKIVDPDAEVFFTIIGGEPVTFGEFNARIEEDFEIQKLKGNQYD